MRQRCRTLYPALSASGSKDHSLTLWAISAVRPGTVSPWKLFRVQKIHPEIRPQEQGKVSTARLSSPKFGGLASLADAAAVSLNPPSQNRLHRQPTCVRCLLLQPLLGLEQAWAQGLVS